MDRRTKYTKNIIKTTFLTLLEEKEINKITVSEICEIADINRATFYRYYLDAYDLLDKIEEEFVLKLKEASKNDVTNYSVSSFCNKLLEVLVEDKKLAKVIFNTKNNMDFLNDILEIVFNKCRDKWTHDLPNVDSSDIEYATVFIFNGALGIINYWIKNDFSEDVKAISSLIEILCYSGTNKFIYKKNIMCKPLF